MPSSAEEDSGNNDLPKNITDRAKSYAIKGIIADGMDVLDVYLKVKEAIDDATVL